MSRGAALATVTTWHTAPTCGGDTATIERLASRVSERPDLADVAPFWLAIYEVQVGARQELASAWPGLLWRVRRERIASGQPQLDFEDLQVTAGPLDELVRQLEQAWRRFDPDRPPVQADWPARLRSVFADPTLSFGQRRDLAFADALALLGLVPYLEWAAAAVVPALQEYAPEWSWGRCPVCGGYPDLAVLFGDPPQRSLICSRCSSAWPFHRVGCPFCRDTQEQAYCEGEDSPYRLYLCGACRRYLKTVDARKVDPVDPRVERLVTIGMDLAALEAGYGPQQTGEA